LTSGNEKFINISAENLTGRHNFRDPCTVGSRDPIGKAQEGTGKEEVECIALFLGRI